MRSSWSVLALVLVAGAVVIPSLFRQPASLTVYCAHDAIFADDIIRLFEKRSGIAVEVRYDEEANKSLGLTNLLIAEKDRPRCDVFWNNQTLGTIRLMDHGVLAPFKGTGYERIPSPFKDVGGHWTGFAARMRVFIVNSEQLTATEEEVAELLASESLNTVAIAIPLYGTTLTHYSVLAAEMGLEELKKWHHSLQARGIREARGNGSVKDLVAEGACALGFTDTDDVFVAMDQGKPVKMLPIRTTAGKTIVIPNSVAMIRGCQHPDAAQKFIDFLLSAEVELLLAQSASRQIPLGDVDRSRLPDSVQELMNWAGQGVEMEAAAQLNDSVLEWLSGEYVQQ